MLHALQTVLVLVFPALVILGGVRDAVSYTIPNWISLALVAAFVPAGLALGLPPAAFGMHAAVGVAALAAGVAMFAFGWIGGGDAKLLAASALWLGWPAVGTFLAVTGMAGGALSVGLLLLRAPKVRFLTLRGPRWFLRLAEPGEGVPYGVAIAIGALVAFPGSPISAPF